MKIRALLATFLLATSQLAVADYAIVTLIEAIELSPSNMILPASSNGLMTYKPCDDSCDADYERALLTPETTYSVSGEAVRFEDFQKAFAQAKASDSSYALLSVELKTRTIKSIDIER